MATSTITCTYRIYQTGVSAVGTFATNIAAAPIDYSYIYQNGLYVASDTTTTVFGPPSYVQRALVLNMLPSSAATATAAVQPEGVAGGYGPLSTAVTVTGAGEDYVQAPQVGIADPTGSGASAVAYLNVVAVQVIKGGTGYLPASGNVVQPAGGLAPFVVGAGGAASGAAQATFTLGFAGGAVQTCTVNTNGGPYSFAPTLNVFSPSGGVGAVLRARMQVSQINVRTQGQGYTNPTVSLTPYYKAQAPDTATKQAGLLYAWMRRIIENYCNSPVYELAPVAA